MSIKHLLIAGAAALGLTLAGQAASAGAAPGVIAGIAKQATAQDGGSAVKVHMHRHWGGWHRGWRGGYYGGWGGTYYWGGPSYWGCSPYDYPYCGGYGYYYGGPRYYRHYYGGPRYYYRGYGYRGGYGGGWRHHHH
jgi:hypothetical protein